MSFLSEAVHAAEGGIYEFKEFLRTRCRIADADITVAIGDSVQEAAVQFVEGAPVESDDAVWQVLANASAGSTEINYDRGDVVIVVEFDL